MKRASAQTSPWQALYASAIDAVDASNSVAAAMRILAVEVGGRSEEGIGAEEESICRVSSRQLFRAVDRPKPRVVRARGQGEQG